MSIKKKIKRKTVRAKQAKKAGAVAITSSSGRVSKAGQDTPRSHKNRFVKRRVVVADPTSTKLDWRQEQARLQGMREGLQQSSIGLLARAVGGFVNGLNSCPNCDEPLPNGRYQVKCKCGYYRIGSTNEFASTGMLITGMFAAAFGAIAALLTLNDLDQSKKESKVENNSNFNPNLKLLPPFPPLIGKASSIEFTGERKTSVTSPTIPNNIDPFDFDFDNPKNHVDNSNVIHIKLYPKDDNGGNKDKN